MLFSHYRRGAVLLFTALLLPICLLAQPHKLSSALSEQLVAQPQASHYALIVLSDQVDLLALHHQLNAQQASPAERARTVGQALHQRSAAAQQGLIDKLERLDKNIRATALRRHWLVNAIELRASAATLRAASYWPEVARIEVPLVAAYDASAQVTAAPPVPNGREPGLTAINAPAMWALGYTGYGRTACVADLAPDYTHPALTTTFAAQYRATELAWMGDLYEESCGDHGTHVNGTMVGLDRLRRDTIGVAFNAHWIAVPLRLLGCDTLGNSVLTGMEYALDPDGDPSTTDDMPDVINCSWGYNNNDSLDCDGNTRSNIGLAAEALGIAIVWSAGNSGPEQSTVYGFKNIAYSLVNPFNVGALNANNVSLTIADFSSRGPSYCPQPEDALNILPEVCAPGVQVRSGLNGGGYGNLNGTSMAAPHVSGALLLLKEAFPQLTGESLKYALYYSARDLGDPGEDNTYGRGIIDVYAAYQYLLQQGHTPTPPAAAHQDVLIAGLNYDDSACDYLGGEIMVENAGQDSIRHLDLMLQISYRSTDGRRIDTFTLVRAWEGILAPGESRRIEVRVPSAEVGQGVDEVFAAGRYQVRVEVRQRGEVPGDRLLNNRATFYQLSLSEPSLRPTRVEIAAADQGMLCADTRQLLQTDYQGPGVVQWLAVPSDSVLNEGSTYLTPRLSPGSYTYRAKLALKNLGRVSPDMDSSSYESLSPEYGLTLTAHNYLRFRSVQVWAQQARPLIIQLCDEDGTCETRTYPVRVGPNRIPLTWEIVPGKRYTMSRLAGPRLLYSTSDAGFPYQYPGLLTISGSTHPLNYYLYFYDWELEYQSACAPSEIAFTVAEDSTLLVAAFQVPDTIRWSEDEPLQPLNKSLGAVAYLWQFGDGNTSTLAIPTHYYEQPGRYTVSLITQDSSGCSDATTATVVVQDDVIISTEGPSARGYERLGLYPNPTNGQLWLELPVDLPADARLSLHDGWGRQLQVWQAPQPQLAVSTLPPGLYILRLQAGQRYYMARFVKQ